MEFWMLCVLLLASLPAEVWGHARLMSPPSRSSMWRVGFPTKKNFNDNALYCGGMTIQWQKNGGKCGICGDPYNMPHPRENEAGGKYGQGIISMRYKAGQVIEATVDVTTNHRGYFEFRLCPNNNPKKEATQECLDKYLLKEAHGTGTRYYIGDRRNGNVTVKLQLPKSLTCSQCVFQWTYVAGNNWGMCEDGVSRLGCGPQETFRGCADIAIERGTDVFNENDVENKPHQTPDHKNKKQGHPKDVTTTKYPDYVFNKTKHSRDDDKKIHPRVNHKDFHGHNKFDHKNIHYTPFIYSRVATKFPLSGERHPYGTTNSRKNHKFDNRHFYYHSNHNYPFYHESLPGKQVRSDKNEQDNIKTTSRPDSSRKSYNATSHRNRKPQRQPIIVITGDSLEDDRLLDGFSLGGRRYKDFWLL